MAKRYPRSGNTDEALTAPATDVRELLGDGFHTDPNGNTRKFRLRSVWAYNSHATDTALIQVYDQDEGVAVAANEKFAFPVPPETYVKIDFPAPGYEFFTNLTAAVTNGTIAIYQAGAIGYEEG